MRSFCIALLCAALFINVAFTARAATLPTLPAPNESFDSGMLHVDRYGSGAKALVFIPGLGCGPWSWAEQIAHFSPEYTVYALTLPGFDGRPATTQSDLIGGFSRDFWAFLDERHLDKPVVIGHSLGGTLSIALAEEHPERLGGVVALDGLPVFPMLAMADAADRENKAKAMAAQIGSETHAQMLAYEKQFMQTIGTTNTDLVEPTAALEANSDPKAVAAWFYADLSTDLRPQLAKATVPMTELVPYTAPAQYTQAQVLGFYKMLFTGAPNANLVLIDHARHFAMLDQPQTVDTAITRFLASLK